jgi:hypothetical protein
LAGPGFADPIGAVISETHSVMVVPLQFSVASATSQPRRPRPST